MRKRKKRGRGVLGREGERKSLEDREGRGRERKREKRERRVGRER